MGKYDERPITEADLSAYLGSEDDFKFELDVLSACLSCDPMAEHGGTYQDPHTGLSRQFDIRMRLNFSLSSAAMAIECKNLKPFNPLLVSRAPRRSHESWHQSYVSHLNECKVLTHFGTLYPQGEPVGKSTVQVAKPANPQKSQSNFITGDEEVYGKWSQAIASAHDLVKSAMLSNSYYGETAVMPALVIPDHTLWVVDYEGDGSFYSKPYMVMECSIYLDKEYTVQDTAGKIQGKSFKLSHLNIFTLSGLQSFLLNAKERQASFCPTAAADGLLR